MEEGLMDYLFVNEIKYKKKCRGIYKMCPICGQLFFAPITELKRGGGMYCSRKCSVIKRSGKNNSKWKPRVICVCKWCGKEFKVQQKDKKNGRGIYCSLKCKGEAISGKNNIRWEGGDIKCICEYCGKEFYKPKSIIKKGWGKYCSNKCQGLANSGECCHLWKGGLSSNSQLFRSSEQYADWRNECMDRDNFTCQKCGKQGGILNVHHIKRVKDIFDEYDIKTKDDWMNCSELWDLNNGITLCENCHKEIHFGKKEELDV